MRQMAPIPGFREKNAHLWFDGFGKLAGIAICEDGLDDFAILSPVGYRFLFGEILDWVVENWGGRECGLTVELRESQATEQRRLGSAGFRAEASSRGI